MDTDIFILVLDSVRADRILGEDSLPTPGIDQLSRDGISFTNAYTSGPWSVPAHASLLTGMLPSSHGSYGGFEQLSVNEEDTLPWKLRNEGYHTACFSTNPWLSPKFGYDKGFDEFIELIPGIPFPNAGDPREIQKGDSRYEFGKNILTWLQEGPLLQRLANSLSHKFQNTRATSSAEELNDRLYRWLSEINDSANIFALMNYMDAHEPYQPHAEYLSGPVSKYDDLDISWNHQSLTNPVSGLSANAVRDVYDASVRYIDAQVADLIKALRHAGRYDSSYVVVLSDHGQSLGEHDYWGHGTYLYEEIVHVPLIIKPPEHSASRLIDESVSLRDVPEYILEEVRGKNGKMGRINKVLEGKSETSEPVVVESHGPYDTESLPEGAAPANGYHAIYAKGWRLVRNLDTEAVTFERLLDTDYDEEVVKDELLSFETTYRREKPNRKTESASISESTRQRLDNLGYR